jgi:hypothetical protein
MVQVGQGNRGNVTVSPTLVINNVQYRGRLDTGFITRYMALNLSIKHLISEIKRMLLIIASS